MNSTRRMFVCAASGVMFMLAASVAYAGGVGIVAPADGSSVPLLSPDMKSYLAMDRTARKAFFADAGSRKRMAAWKDKPLPVMLKWTGPANMRYSVVVKREPDGAVFFKGKTSKKELKLWNLEIARTYSWRVDPVEGGAEGAGGRFTTEDIAPRLIKVDGIPNIRDFGGRVGLGGRRVRQGRVFRSAGLNSNANSYYKKDDILKMIKDGTLVESVPEKSKAAAQKILDCKKKGERPDYNHLVKHWHPGAERLNTVTRAYMRETLGIKTDIDLRTDRECYGMTASPLGEGVKWIHVSSSAYGGMGSDNGREAFKQVFKVFLDEANYPIDFHCIAGADRTGSLAYILNALLGVDEDELWKDWEVTAFQNGKLDFGMHRIERLVAVFAKYPGASERERVEAYVKAQGFTDGDIAKFRAIMLEDASPVKR